MKIKLQSVDVDHQQCYAIRVTGFDPEFPNKIKKAPRTWWSPAHKAWLMPRSQDSLAWLEKNFGTENVELPSSGETDTVEVKLPEFGSKEALSIKEHPENKDWLCLFLPQSLMDSHLATVKNIHGRKWNPGLVCWEIPYTQTSIRFIEKYLRGRVKWNFQPRQDIPERNFDSNPTPVQAPKQLFVPAKYEAAVTALEQTLMLKRYSWRTIKNYKNCFRSFIRHYDEIKPSQITRTQINQYLSFLVQEHQISQSYQSQVMSAIKMFYTSVLTQEEKVKGLFQPKRPQRLPKVLSEEEVTALLRAVDNLKHRCILMLVYSAGLRLGELINLRLHDLQPEQNRLWVRNGKGGKDRCTILSEKVWIKLKEYIDIYRPVEWVFEGQQGGAYSERSVQKVFTFAKMRAMINPHATVHTLRHSFATHLLEKGVNLRYIQDLLGHESSKTTEIYTHITQKGIGKVKSPIDDLNI